MLWMRLTAIVLDPSPSSFAGFGEELADKSVLLSGKNLTANQYLSHTVEVHIKKQD